MPAFWTPLRRALRTLGKDRSYTVIAVLTLALGIGATTALYTVVHSVLLEPLPYPESQRLALMLEQNPDAGLPRFSMAPLNFRDYREMSRSFEYMAARTGASLALTTDDGRPARRLDARAVTYDYLRTLGVEPVLGRDLSVEDDQPDATPVLLLGHQLWQEMGGRDSIVGQTLRIDGQSTTVIGVLPPNIGPRHEAIVPMRIDYEASGRGAHWVTGFARLRPGVSFEQARNELSEIAARLEAQYPESNTGWSALVLPLREEMVSDVELALWVLLSAVLLVLLIACANVANLTLARLAAREREIALEAALGASRGRVLGRLLGESLIIALSAGLLGLLLARQATSWLSRAQGVDLPRAESIAVDGGVLIVALLISLGTTLLFGLMPALLASRTDLAGALKEGGRGQASGRRGQRLRTGLVVAEVALALILLASSGVLLRSFTELLKVDPGFVAEGVWSASMDLPEEGYGEAEQRQEFLQRLLEEADALPGVQSAALVTPMVLGNNQWVNTIYVEGEPVPDRGKERTSYVRFTSPDFFDALSVPILAGRPFDDRDRADANPVAILNKMAAERYWPGENPIGKRVTTDRPDGEEVEWLTVVGLVDDLRSGSLERPEPPTLYLSYAQEPPRFLTVVLRSAGPSASSLAEPLRQLMRQLEPSVPLYREQAVTAYLDDSVAEPRFNTTLLTLFALLALVLASIGVFGVVSYGVSQRTREMGVRQALGARAKEIAGLVVRQGMRPVLAGVLVGLAGAALSARLLSSLVYGVNPIDPLTYVTVGLLLALAAVAACLLPALRATRVEPMEALRDQ